MNFNTIKNPLASKLLITVLISSTIITFFTILIQLFFEYNADIKLIENRIDQVEKSYTHSLALSVWNFNENQYNTQLNGILNLEDIVYVEILTPDNKQIIFKGKNKKTKKLTKEFILKTVDFNQIVTAGKLIVTASLDRVYDDLFNRAFIILITQGIKTLLISFIILYSFYILVTKHLYIISRYTKNLDIDSNNVLDLKRGNHKEDGLDHIVFALNNMQNKIQENNSNLKQLNQNLELKVKERTQELEELNSTLSTLTNIDPLTGAYNRRYFYNISKELISLSKRENQYLSISMIDIDDFKKINDTYGHDKGDNILKELVNLINKTIRDSDLLIRFGGEEFVIVLPHTDIKQSTIILEKIRSIIEKSVFIDGIKFTISIGISQYIDNEDIESTLKRADTGLYRAKNSGKNKIEIN